ncbi:MAG: hypothetical protein PHS62_00735 [Patescibacteria group bacterium]|nr:hypothetical protein [Patescibacteria group bacterium]
MQTEPTIEQRAIQEIAEHFGKHPANIKAETHFHRDLGVEKYYIMTFLYQRLGEVLNVRINPSDANFQTVGDVLDYLNQRVGQGAWVRQNSD